jgi:hypothetical protein
MLIIQATTPLGHAVAGLLTRLCAVVAHHAVRNPLRALLALANERLFRLAGRIDRLAHHWQHGTLPKPRAPRPAARRAPRPAQPRLPTPHAWLIRLAQPTAQLRGQMEALLDRADTRALVEAAPQAGRLLRPLCRALAIPPPDWLRLPPRPPRVRPTPAPKPASKPAAPEAGTPDRPLPAYILATVRAWRKNKRD